MSKRKFFFGVLLPMLICCNLSFSQKDDKFYKSYTGHLYDFESLSFKEEFEGADIYKLSDKDKYYQVRFLDGKTDWVGVFNVDTFLLEEYLPGGRLVVHTKKPEGILHENYSIIFNDVEYIDKLKENSVLTKFDAKHNEIEVISYDENGLVVGIHQKKYNNKDQAIEEIFLDSLFNLQDGYVGGCAILKHKFDDKGNKTETKCYNQLNTLISTEQWKYDINGNLLLKNELDSLNNVINSHINVYNDNGLLIEYSISVENQKWSCSNEYDKKKQTQKINFN
jgi:hypothetical protein